jgi:hypothetical protein
MNIGYLVLCGRGHAVFKLLVMTVSLKAFHQVVEYLTTARLRLEEQRDLRRWNRQDLKAYELLTN